MITKRLSYNNQKELLKIIDLSSTNPNTAAGCVMDMNIYPKTLDVLQLYVVGCFRKSRKLVFNFSKLNTASMIDAFIEYLKINKLLISFENGVLITHFDIIECNNLLFSAFETEREIDSLTAEEKVIEQIKSVV
jgi:hypothetical protein